jgi:YVTN family beta-propeller protein
MAPFAALMLVAMGGCAAARTSAAGSLPPLETDGEVFVHLQSPSADVPAFSMAVQSVSAFGSDGEETPLDLALPEFSRADLGRAPLLARGRLAPGTYSGFVVRLRRAPGRDAPSAGPNASDGLLHVEFSFAALPRRATLVFLSPRTGAPDGPGETGMSFVAASPDRARFGATPSLLGFASAPGSHHVAVLDKRAGRLVSVIATGRAPTGIALDPVRNRAFVTLAGDDEVAILDLASGDELGRVVLNAGDVPGEIALTPDRSLLVVVNAGSDTVSLVDPASAIEVQRLSTGEQPVSALIERSGRRAYVFNRRSNTISVLDLVARSVAATVSTEDGPLRGQMNRAGSRLYVVHEGSPYLLVYSLPDLTVRERVFVGSGARAIKVDPRTDLVYLGMADDDRVHVLDPTALLPADYIEAGGPVSFLAIDDTDNQLVLVVPSRRWIAFADLGGRRVPIRLEMGAEPLVVAVMGERH